MKKYICLILLLGTTLSAFASLTECGYYASQKKIEKTIKACLPYAEKDLQATYLLSAAYLLNKQYKRSEKYSLFIINYYQKKGVPRNETDL